MKRFLFGTMFLFAGMLVIAGCSHITEAQNSDTPSPQSKSAIPSGENVELTEELTEEAARLNEEDGIALTAKALGDGKVAFQWSVAGISYDQDKGFILVRSEESNPVHDGKNYWFRQYHENRRVTWIDLPTGTMYFRICALQNGECAVYSNDVMVEVR